MKKFGKPVWLWSTNWLTIFVSSSVKAGWRTKVILHVSFLWWKRLIRMPCWLVLPVVLLLTNVRICCLLIWNVCLRSWTILIIRYSSYLQVRLIHTMVQVRGWSRRLWKFPVVRNSWAKSSSWKIMICSWHGVWSQVLIFGWILLPVLWKLLEHQARRLWWITSLCLTVGGWKVTVKEQDGR